MGDVIDFASYLRFVAALVFVLGLILLAAHIAKKFMARQVFNGMRVDGRRLGIVEILPIDARHRAVLIRRDGTEHLVMTGPSGDIVIESGIEPDPNALHAANVTVTAIQGGPPATPEPQTPLQKIVGLFGDRRA